ncbi:putative Endonuclease/exonuclease/phosphatase superfamily [Helianthus annuus]|nr:putative Endonuclease/exonuclease/phosphatase superfamily [Helianthus annuus]KAJ0826707.1 putative Endonuclease/exonuclease/phosphatase superfamily [Helianthus annuus]
MGDFNAVRVPEERRNSVFNSICAGFFNDFIDEAGLIEFGMKGRRFTFLAPNSNKLSKIDRFLVCKDFFADSPESCLRALPRLHSDHCPVLLETNRNNFGPKPFRFFNSWLGRDGFAALVKNAARSFVKNNERPDVVLAGKLRFIKNATISWKKEREKKEKEDLVRDLDEMEMLDRLCEERDLLEEEMWVKGECLKNIFEREIDGLGP